MPDAVNESLGNVSRRVLEALEHREAATCTEIVERLYGRREMHEPCRRALLNLAKRGLVREVVPGYRDIFEPLYACVTRPNSSV